jgi:hypothetical protein
LVGAGVAGDAPIVEHVAEKFPEIRLWPAEMEDAHKEPWSIAKFDQA